MLATGRGVLPAAGALARKQKACLLTSFDGFGLKEAIVRAIAEEKLAAPSPIQQQTISIAGLRRAVIRIAQTGTGRTVWMSSPSRRTG
jgi:ATP-dependent RNA helicase RhlE